MKRLILPEALQSQLLYVICVRFGFCSLTSECHRKLETTPLTVDEYVDTVFRGEGYGEHLLKEQLKLRDKIRDLVDQYYAGEV